MLSSLAFAQTSQEQAADDSFSATFSTDLLDPKQREGAFEDAFRTLKRQNQLQFELPSKPTIQRSNWLDKILEPILKFFSAFTPLFQTIFWVLIVGIVALFLYIIGNALRHVRFKSKNNENGQGNTLPLYRPSQKQALILLEQVDALAAKGQYAEAVHQLLFKSIQDISIARPSVIKRSYTSREISTLGPLDQSTQEAFSLITREVERSHFGAQVINQEAFLRCREAYAQFALTPPTPPQLGSSPRAGQLA